MYIFIYNVNVALWLNRIEQPPPKGQVGGSNPPRVTNKINFYITVNFTKFRAKAPGKLH
jgi:hypothetical protein